MRTRSRDVFKQIPRDKAHRFIGENVHLGWASPSAHWILDEIDGDSVRLLRRRDKRARWDKTENLFATRMNEHLLED